MIYVINDSIMMDCIYYGIIKFNNTYVNNRASTHALDNKYFYYYNKIENVSINKNLYSVFYQSKSFPSLLLDFFMMNKDKVDLKNFIICKADFLEYIYYRILGDKNFNTHNTRAIISALDNTGLEYNIRYLLLELILNYDNIFDVLRDYLTNIYPLIRKLHVENKADIDAMISKMLKNDSEIYKIMNKTLKFKSQKSDNISISLLDPVHLSQTTQNSKTLYRCGIFAENINLNVMLDKVTFESFCNAVLHAPVPRQAFRDFLKGEVMYTSDMASKYNVSITAMARYILEMTNEQALIVNKRKGRFIYYQINPEYKKVLYKICKDILKEYFEEEV